MHRELEKNHIFNPCSQHTSIDLKSLTPYQISLLTQYLEAYQFAIESYQPELFRNFEEKEQKILLEIVGVDPKSEDPLALAKQIVEKQFDTICQSILRESKSTF